MGQFQNHVKENYQPEQFVDTRTGRKRWRYRYKGALYRWDAAPEKIHAIKKQTILLWALDGIFFFLAALLRGSINTDNRIVIPGMISLIGFVYMTWGAIEFCRTKETFQADVLRAWQIYLVGGGLFQGVMVLLACLFGGIHMIQGGIDTGNGFIDACYFLSFLCCAVLVCIHFRLKEKIVQDQESPSIADGEKAQARWPLLR